MQSFKIAFIFLSFIIGSYGHKGPLFITDPPYTAGRVVVVTADEDNVVNIYCRVNDNDGLQVMTNWTITIDSATHELDFDMNGNGLRGFDFISVDIFNGANLTMNLKRINKRVFLSCISEHDGVVFAILGNQDSVKEGESRHAIKTRSTSHTPVIQSATVTSANGAISVHWNLNHVNGVANESVQILVNCDLVNNGSSNNGGGNAGSGSNSAGNSTNSNSSDSQDAGSGSGSGSGFGSNTNSNNGSTNGSSSNTNTVTDLQTLANGLSGFTFLCRGNESTCLNSSLGGSKTFSPVHAGQNYVCGVVVSTNALSRQSLSITPTTGIPSAPVVDSKVEVPNQLRLSLRSQHAGVPSTDTSVFFHATATGGGSTSHFNNPFTSGYTSNRTFSWEISLSQGTYNLALIAGNVYGNSSSTSIVANIPQPSSTIPYVSVVPTSGGATNDADRNTAIIASTLSVALVAAGIAAAAVGAGIYYYMYKKRKNAAGNLTESSGQQL
jgi:hypothetical protein